MPTLISEQQMLQNNIFAFEDRLKTQLSRFQEKTPTYVTYYHIDEENSTVAEGFLDFENLIDERSPLKFKKISDFPLYGIEQIVLQIQDDDQGLDTSYESECMVLPSTIKPCQNDYFTINYLKDSYIFRVTAIEYDSLITDNYYKLSFKIEFISDSMVTKLDSLVNNKYTCILENIGSENRCIIEDNRNEQLKLIDNMYSDMVQTYISIFYSTKYNCLLGELDGDKKIYDPFQTQFINNHMLFKIKGDYSTIRLSNETTDAKRRIKYERSVYRLLERQNVDIISRFPFTFTPGIANQSTSFNRWHDKTVQILDIPLTANDGEYNIFDAEFVTSVEINAVPKTKYAKLLQKFIRGESITIDEIDLTLNSELLQLNANIEVFFITPMLLYVIREVVKSFLKEKK